jgi:predicted AlkP superfamily pyrophosphatase or phosphodiesterase
LFFGSYYFKLTSAATPQIGSWHSGRPNENGIPISFSADFSANGFKRLMNDGYTFHNMHYNFVPTYTAPTCKYLYGTTPSTHGIVGNDWFNKATGKICIVRTMHLLRR